MRVKSVIRFLYNDDKKCRLTSHYPTAADDDMIFGGQNSPHFAPRKSHVVAFYATFHHASWGFWARKALHAAPRAAEAGPPPRTTGRAPRRGFPHCAPPTVFHGYFPPLCTTFLSAALPISRRRRGASNRCGLQDFLSFRTRKNSDFNAFPSKGIRG